jgi:hypothetical protein
MIDKDISTLMWCLANDVNISDKQKQLLKINTAHKTSIFTYIIQVTALY